MEGLLREGGIDPALKGTGFEGGHRNNVLWMPPGGDASDEFGLGDWDGLVMRSVKLEC